ncbi:hypothetical protein [Alistipes putredinis]|uniref:hypothetical protein n=1 Tax=Alistipes putredinis TaxID=28117 RepID=UPI003966F4DF
MFLIISEIYLFLFRTHVPYIFCFDNAYVKIQGDSLVKVLEVKYDYEIVEQKHISKLDAEGFVRAILKDAQTGETTLL